MLYTDNKEVYIKVSGYFIKVNVSKDKNDEYTITPDTNAETIEEYGNGDKFSAISVEKAYEKLSSPKEKIRYKLGDK